MLTKSIEYLLAICFRVRFGQQKAMDKFMYIMETSIHAKTASWWHRVRCISDQKNTVWVQETCQGARKLPFPYIDDTDIIDNLWHKGALDLVKNHRNYVFRLIHLQQIHKRLKIHNL